MASNKSRVVIEVETSCPFGNLQVEQLMINP